jgi:hypothetical protein
MALGPPGRWRNDQRMTTPSTARTRFTLLTSPPDLSGPEMTLTLAEWHRYRDVPDDVLIVQSHEPSPVAA